MAFLVARKHAQSTLFPDGTNHKSFESGNAYNSSGAVGSRKGEHVIVTVGLNSRDELSGYLIFEEARYDSSFRPEALVNEQHPFTGIVMEKDDSIQG